MEIRVKGLTVCSRGSGPAELNRVIEAQTHIRRPTVSVAWVSACRARCLCLTLGLKHEQPVLKHSTGLHRGGVLMRCQ